MKEESRDGVLRLFGMRVLVRDWTPKDSILIASPPPPKLVAIRPATESTGDSAAQDRTAPPRPLTGSI